MTRRGGGILTLATRQDRLVLAAVAGGLLLAVLWCYSRLSASRDAAASAASDLADSRGLAERIEGLRRRPAFAGAGDPRAADVSRRIEQAAQAAGFADGSLERIAPEPPRRLERGTGLGPVNHGLDARATQYKEVPTRVTLRRVTMRQVFAFLHALGAEAPAPAAPPLGLKTIHLTAPRADEASDDWGVEATLTHLVHDPTVPDGDRGAGGRGAGDFSTVAGR
jgi:hypothetical protein